MRPPEICRNFSEQFLFLLIMRMLTLAASNARTSSISLRACRKPFIAGRASPATFAAFSYSHPHHGRYYSVSHASSITPPDFDALANSIKALKSPLSMVQVDHIIHILGSDHGMTQTKDLSYHLLRHVVMNELKLLDAQHETIQLYIAKAASQLLLYFAISKKLRLSVDPSYSTAFSPPMNSMVNLIDRYLDSLEKLSLRFYREFFRRSIRRKDLDYLPIFQALGQLGYSLEAEDYGLILVNQINFRPQYVPTFHAALVTQGFDSTKSRIHMFKFHATREKSSQRQRSFDVSPSRIE